MKHYWESNELTECWSLNFEELALLKSKPPKNHLPFCFQLKFYQHLGRFPQSYDEIAEAPLKYLKEQLDEFEIEEYDWKGRTAKRHRAEILKYLDIRKSTTKNAAEAYQIASKPNLKPMLWTNTAKAKQFKLFRYSSEDYLRGYQAMSKGALTAEALADGYTLKTIRQELSK